MNKDAKRNQRNNRVKLLKRTVDEWNEMFPIGQKVMVWRDNGDVLRTVTTSKASLLGGHTPVVWVEGITGCYDLKRVRPRLGE